MAGDPETSSCAVCSGTKCVACNPLLYKACRVCGNPIPRAALRCNDCESYQRGILRPLQVSHTTLALVAAILTAATPLVRAGADFYNRESRTSVVFAGATDQVLLISATNTGRKPSVIIKCTLTFDPALGIEAVPLELEWTNGGHPVPNDVAAGGNVRIGFIASEVVTRKTKLELRQELTGSMTLARLTVFVEESDGEREVARDIPVAQLVHFIVGKAGAGDES